MANNDLQWRSCPCLVTGGGGFGGAHLCEQLAKAGARVFILDHQIPINSYLHLSDLFSKLSVITGDIRDRDLLKLLMERYQISIVFHLAAQPIVPISNDLPFETLDINIRGTYTLLDAIRTSRFCNKCVFASSAAYYGKTVT